MDSERVRYIYYGNDLIAEVKVTVNSNGTVTNSTLSRGYHWMSGGAGEALRLLSVQDYERGAVALPGYDGRGNIVTWTNGANGELIGTADYGPYGERFDIWWATPVDEKSYERFGFGTEYRDETGLIYYGARYFSPALGRFISKDPAGTAGSGVNLYAFCSGDPVNHRELYGLCDGGWWGDFCSWFTGGGDTGGGSGDSYSGYNSAYTNYQPTNPDVDDEIYYMDPFVVTVDRYTGWESIESYVRDMMIEEANSYAQHCLDESTQAFSDSINWDTPELNVSDDWGHEAQDAIKRAMQSYIRSLYCNIPPDVLKLLSRTKAGRGLLALITSGQIVVISCDILGLKDWRGKHPLGITLSANDAKKWLGLDGPIILLDENYIRSLNGHVRDCGGEARAILNTLLNEYASIVLGNVDDYRDADNAERQRMELRWQQSVDQDYGLRIDSQVYEEWIRHTYDKQAIYQNKNEMKVNRKDLNFPSDAKVWAY